MKKNRFLIPFAAVLSAALIPVFAYYFDKTESLDAFIELCRPINALASKSSGFSASAPGFAAGPGTAILKLPSIDSNGLPMAEYDDICAVSLSGRKVVFTCFPAVLSRRTAETLLLPAPKSMTFTYTGETLLLMASYGRHLYAMDFETGRSHTVIPENRKWF